MFFTVFYFYLCFWYEALFYAYLFQGNIALEKSKRRKPFGWIPDEGWEDCNRLTAEYSNTFGTLLDDIERNEKTWKAVRVEEDS